MCGSENPPPNPSYRSKYPRQIARIPPLWFAERSQLHAHRDRLWRFAESEGVEPTNNASERALRPAVIWRKLSFGTRSAQGSRFVETLLSVVETCRRQSRNVFEYLTTALEAQLAGQPIPSLLSGA
jgi:transposase